ncbi:MAG TPA: class I SAM-dependent methyltransferase [Caldilineaceae bacterium]|nr:class I SAM-dependent methyltransferase [Caldilineaceae bacterium]
MNLERLKELQERPVPFAPGEALFWDDPHISTQTLAAHLDPTNDRASRRPQTIARSVAWIVESLGLHPGSAVLDLGCGPGLYAVELARRGIAVTGVDGSRRSIAYAEKSAQQAGLKIRYRYENYLALEDREEYDAALLIYGDFCPLAPAQRSKLLQNVHRALKPGGHFVLDVTTPIHRQRYGNRNGWYVAESGFWKPGPHLVLEEGFDYPEHSIFLDQATVIEANGKLSVYRNWFQDYSRESITAELETGGFRVESVWSDLTGTPYSDETEWIGVVAKRGKGSADASAGE